jgi:hypothetical protein
MTPRNPYLILLIAIVLPGAGHVFQGLAQRGLTFLFFVIILSWASLHLMPPGSSFIGKHIGGFFIYGLQAIDAYKIARIRITEWRHAQDSRPNM